jgi:hypothetical protein
MTETTAGTGNVNSVRIADRFGHTYEITMDGVRRLATEPPRFGAGRVWVEVDDRSLPAVDLIVRLTNTEDHMFRLTDLESALRQLGFKVERRNARPPEPVDAARSAVRRHLPARLDDEDHEFVPALFSSAAAKAMEEFAGQWIGVRADQVVAHGSSPGEILESSHASEQDPVTVLFVPLAPGRPVE